MNTAGSQPAIDVIQTTHEGQCDINNVNISDVDRLASTWPWYASFLALTVSNSSSLLSFVKNSLICPWNLQNLSQSFHLKGSFLQCLHVPHSNLSCSYLNHLQYSASIHSSYNSQFFLKTSQTLRSAAPSNRPNISDSFTLIIVEIYKCFHVLTYWLMSAHIEWAVIMLSADIGNTLHSDCLFPGTSWYSSRSPWQPTPGKSKCSTLVEMC